MIEFKVNHDNFTLKYLPEFADYLLSNKVTEFVTVGIRFSREADLPMLKPLSKYSEDELVALSIESNKEMLTALSTNKLGALVEANSQKWISNSLVVIDKDELRAEDLTLAFYLRRKIFAYFLDGYSKNIVLQKFIIAELDYCTTQEEIISYNIYLKMQHEKLELANQTLAFHEDLFLEAQKLGGMGSFMTNFKNEASSFYSPEYKSILGMEKAMDFDEFVELVHPDDKDYLRAKLDKAFQEGGNFEVTYRFVKNSKEKKIWSKGFVESHEGKPSVIRGIIKEI